MNRLKSVLQFVFWLCPWIGLAQQTAIGRWQDHYSYNHVFSIVVLQDEISAVTENGLFYYNKKENSVRRKTTIQGLSGVGLSASNYDASSQIQIIGYQNGNIDLILQNGRIINIPDIQRWQMLGSKKINKIIIENSQKVYLCCDFGIVVLNLLKQEISERYFIGQNGSFLQINDLTFSNDSIYVATHQGLMKANRFSHRLSDFREWDSIPINAQYGQSLESVDLWNNHLIVHQRFVQNNITYDTVWTRDSEGQWDILDTNTTVKIKVSKNRLFQLRAIPNHYLYEILEYNSDFNISSSTQEKAEFWGLEDVELDSENNLWLSTGFYGLTRLRLDWTFQENIFPRGPSTNHVFALSHSLSTLYAAEGRVGSIVWEPGHRSFTVNYFQNNTWNLLSYRNFSHWISDAISIVEDPTNPNVFFVASWQAGVAQGNTDGTGTLYDTTNSSLRGFWRDDRYYIRGGDVKFDSKNQLWVTTANSEHHLHKRDPSGQWKPYDLGHVIATDPREFIIDYYDQLWIRTQWNGLVFFRETNNGNGYEALRADLNNGNNQQISGLNCMVEDKRGFIWLGTEQGILINRTSRQLFDPPNNGLVSKVTFETINYEGLPLFGNENVTAIAIDGADRKWIGTASSGVFLMSADGREMIHHFNTQNSPLNSNSITALTINPRTGEVFIGTDKGLMSYGGNATLGSRTKQDMIIFPNPVRSDFTGEIGIRGLAENAKVHITDVSGVLVFETTANGGMATWNGHARNGQRVKPGVYTVFSVLVDEYDGSLVRSVGKIFINR